MIILINIFYHIKYFFSSIFNNLFNFNIYIICVPTPVNKNNKPDLSWIKLASKIVGKVLGEKDLVVYESTVYPGMTEEVCIPILEKYSKLKGKKDGLHLKNKRYFYCG